MTAVKKNIDRATQANTYRKINIINVHIRSSCKKQRYISTHGMNYNLHFHLHLTFQIYLQNDVDIRNDNFNSLIKKWVDLGYMILSYQEV